MKGHALVLLVDGRVKPGHDSKGKPARLLNIM